MDSQTSGALPIAETASHISHVPEEGFKRPVTAHELFDLASAGVNILYAASDHVYGVDSDAFFLLCGLHRQIAEAHDWAFAAKWIGERRES